MFNKQKEISIYQCFMHNIHYMLFLLLECIAPKSSFEGSMIFKKLKIPFTQYPMIQCLNKDS